MDTFWKSNFPYRIIYLSALNDFKTILTESTNFEIFKSKSELVRMIKNNGLSINKDKINNEDYIISDNLKFNKYLLLQKGKKNYTFIIVE